MQDTLSRIFNAAFGSQPTLLAAAPGRIEFIGNHTDYNGGLVLGTAIDRFIGIALRPRTDRTVRLVSDQGGDVVTVAIDALAPLKGATAWANYPLGVLASLGEEGLKPAHGFDLAVTSNLPPGAGLSSSAAFEMATMEALCALYGFQLDGVRKVLAGQRAENRFVGVPCGMLDQGVSHFGRRDHLVRIDCATASFSTLPLPAGLHFWIFNTNKKHSLVDSLYATRFRECREALAGLQAAGAAGATHLVGIASGQLESLGRGLDPILLRRARHVIEENERVAAVGKLLEQGDIAGVGRQLLASHQSSSRLFENSIPELDTLVELLGRTSGVLGARLTGGGFGGAAMALTDAAFGSTQADQVVAAYRERHPTAAAPSVLHVQTADGARLL